MVTILYKYHEDDILLDGFWLAEAFLIVQQSIQTKKIITNIFVQKIFFLFFKFPMTGL